MTFRSGLFVGTAVLLAGTPFPALAQVANQENDDAVTSSAGGTTASNDDAAKTGEILVTATRRAERLRDVPQSITAVTADDLARLNAVQLRDYANTIPAMTVVSTGGVGRNLITLRGVTSGADIAATVSNYVDDVPYGGSTVYSINAGLALDAGLFDLDRIEVLRGPQGTLYGASSMGGLLKYVTRQPNLNEFEGSARAGLSFTKDGGANYNAAAAVSAPLVAGRLGVRAGGYYSRDGGYVDNVTLGEKNVGRANVYGGRLDLLFQPIENLSVRLTGFAQDIDREGNAQVDYTLKGKLSTGDLEQQRLLREPFNQKFRVVSGTVNYDFGPANLTSITSYQTNDARFRTDASSLYVPLLKSIGLVIGSAAVDNGISTDKFTQEVRLTSSDSGMIQWIIGGFYTNEDSVGLTNLIPYNADGSLYPLNLVKADLLSTYKELAAFGNLTVHLTDRFDVTGGLRYAHNRQSYTQNATGILAPSVPTQYSRENVLTYLANARYRISPNATAYARFATGYRPGGPNIVTIDPVTGQSGGVPFKSDTLKSYEVGFRGETVDRTFGVDLGVYHIDWNDMLISGIRNGVNNYLNAGGAKIDGAELTLTARPSSNLAVTGAFALQDARLSSDSIGVGKLGGKKGDPLPNVPKYSAAINADYTAGESRLSPAFGATVRYVSERNAGFNGNANLPQYDLGSYVSVDLRAGVGFGPVRAQAFVRNLFDVRGATAAYVATASLGGAARVSVIQPRTIGVSLTSNF